MQQKAVATALSGSYPTNLVASFDRTLYQHINHCATELDIAPAFAEDQMIFPTATRFGVAP
ncbi:hypothetical protein ACVWWG_001825 [Bradyrhizobium sp. LB7.2]